MAFPRPGSVLFYGGSPLIGDILHLDSGCYEVTDRQWREVPGRDFELEVLLAPWPCYDDHDLEVE